MSQSMVTFSLQSGSNGNCIYVEGGGRRLLFDAGISGRQAKLRLAEHGREIFGIDALLISHDHSDHVCNAGVLQRLFKMPVYMTSATYARARRYLGKMHDVRHFTAGDVIEFGPVRVYTLPTPHDAVDGVVFTVELAGKRLGIFTDVGHAFPGLGDALASVDAAYLESNYDPEMLDAGSYPADVKERIRGHGGHLSNREAAELIKACAARHRWVALAHLSEDNNHPDIALQTHRSILGETFPLTVAGRYTASEILNV